MGAPCSFCDTNNEKYEFSTIDKKDAVLIRNELLTRKNLLEPYVPQHVRFDNKIREDRPEYTFLNGDVYIGEWDIKTKRIDGNGELFSLNDESLYEGHFVNGCRSIHGRVVFRNGDVYTGGWMNDEMMGTGKFTSADGKSVYEGEWVANEKHG